jgi:multiple sugar transport system permease protein
MSTLTLRADRKSTARSRTKVEQSKARRDENRRRTRWIWLFLLPTAILYGLYTLYPIVASYWYSLVEWNGFEADQRFVGIKNYQAVFADPMFWSSVKITLIFMLLVAPARVILSFLLAIVLNSPKLPFATLFRTVYFLPVVTTTAIVGVVMQFIFDPSSGPVNSALRAFGISDGVSFLGDSSTALYTVAGVYVWKFFGVTMISIFRHITVPLLMPFLIIISLLTVEDTFRAFDLMQTMTGGGPFFSTEIIEIYIYRWAFAASIPQLGFASAAAVLFGLFVFAVGLIQLWGVYTARRLRADNQ